MRKTGVVLATAAIAALLLSFFVIRDFRLRVAVSGLPEPPTAGAPADLVESLASCRAAVVNRPRSDDAWGVYGLALYGNDFFPQAAICFARAEELSPEKSRWPHLLALCLPQDARPRRIAALERALAANPAQAASAAALVEDLLEDDLVERAESALTSALAFAPSDERLAFLRSRIHVRKGEYDAAIRICEGLVRSRPTRRDVRHLALESHRGAGQAAEAAIDAKALALLDAAPPDPPWEDPLAAQAVGFRLSSEWRRLRAIKAGERGDYAAAAAEIEKLPPDERKTLEMRVLAASCGARTGARPDAEGELRALANEDPRDSMATLELANLQLARGRYSDAAASFEEALRRLPGIDVAHHGLGVCRWMLDRKADALRSFAAAFAANPLNGAVARKLASGLIEAGRAAEAKKVLDDALLLSPDDSVLLALRKRIAAAP
ncbi:MAG TPA: tetratricopeptide repeat protein [Planctomycetia bacterium]|nr:tetratricopeptide repeat protein [Planctomycetia bacterium]